MSALQRSVWDDELLALLDPAVARILACLPEDLRPAAVRLLLDYCAQHGVDAGGREEAAAVVVSADFRPVLENDRDLNALLAAYARPASTDRL